MKIINFSLSSLAMLTLIGCGPSGSIDSTNNQSSTTNTDYSVTLERGPIFGATVKDANNKIATNTDSSNLNIYVFEEEPIYPITVTGGYVDVNYDNKIDTNDIALNVTLSSYSNIISPLNTFIGNDTTRLDFIKSSYGLSEDDIKNNTPSSISSKTIILSNAIYKLLVNNTSLTTTSVSNEYTTVNNVYTASFSGETNLKTLATALENDTITTLTISKLTSAEATSANEAIWGKALALTNSTFSKTKKTTDDVSDIWNMGLNIPSNQTVSDFDIAVNIVKSTSGTIGNIVIEDISIANNVLNSAQKVYVFGKKTNGSTSSISYDNTKNITKNAVSLVEGMLLIDLGYIISNQDVVSADKFTSIADYDVKIYITKLDTSNAVTSTELSIEKNASESITIPSGSQQITGTIKVGN